MRHTKNYENYVEKLTKWVETQPCFNNIYERREIPGGGRVVWYRRKVSAVSSPGLGPVEAITFYQVISSLVPDGWEEDPIVELLPTDRVLIRGKGSSAWGWPLKQD